MPESATPKASFGHGERVAALGAGATLLLMGAGGYLLYLHAGALLAQGQALPPVLILGLAVVGGAASFFSPCSIAVTPAFVAYLATGTAAPENARRCAPALALAAGLVALGIIAFYAIAGAIIGAVGSIAYNYLIYLIPAVATVFVVLGILMLVGRTGMLSFVERWNPMNRRYTRQEAGPTTAGPPRKRTLVSFGFAYGAASHTCSLPIFLGILLLPLVAGNYPLAALSVFAYGVAIALLVVVMMLLGQRVFAGLRRSGPWLMRITALLFLGTGGFLFYYFGQSYDSYVTDASAAHLAAVPSAHQYHLVEGAGTYPYRPRALVIPMQQTVQVAVTDHIGGCLLSTVFEGLGPRGGTAQVTVPVGTTRTIGLYAPRAGTYVFHCGGNMYSGTVVAR